MGKLYRSSDKVIAGVCAGIAKEFGIDVKLARIIYSVVDLFTGGILLTVVYAILAFMLPEEGK